MQDDGQYEPLVGGRYGQKLAKDPSFRGVREEGRRCNDILFVILFLLVFLAMVAICVVGFAKGDPSKLLSSSEMNEAKKSESFFENSIAEAKQGRYIYAAAIALALILGLVWIQLLKTFTKFFIYCTAFLGVFVLVALGTYLLISGLHKSNFGMQVTSYIAFGAAFIVLVIVIFLRKKIALTAALFEECCRGIEHNPGVFAVSMIITLGFTSFVAFWSTAQVYLFSVPNGEVDITKDDVHFNEKTRDLVLFNIFGFFWTTAFISAVFQMSIAGAIAKWYFSRDVHGFGNVGSPAFRSLGRAFTFSFGSLAFGSLLLAIIQFINFLLKRMKNVQRGNAAARAVLCLVQCCVNCLLKLIEFIDEWAYIYIAMHGESFCNSARKSFELVSRNMFSAVVVDLLGTFVLFVGKIFGTAACTLFTVFLLEMYKLPLSAVGITLVVIVSYMIFHMYAHIMSVGVDTVFVCYLEDLERNGEQGLYITPELHVMLKEKIRTN